MSQPPQQTGKRIVSKGEYVRTHLLQSGLATVSFFLFGFAFVCLLGTLCLLFLLCLLPALLRDEGGISIQTVYRGGLALLLTSAGTYLFLKAGMITQERAAKLEPWDCLVYASTADLPAPASLVRASEEPAQEQQAVLLRAAETHEQHEEQLVRAAASETMQFNFQVEGAVSVWYGRFTTIWGTLLDGTMQTQNYISLPAKNGGRLVTTILDIEVGHKIHSEPVTGRCELVAMRTWGPVIDPEKIEILGIATRSEESPFKRSSC
jgi:hypothetical protein